MPEARDTIAGRGVRNEIRPDRLTPRVLRGEGEVVPLGKFLCAWRLRFSRRPRAVIDMLRYDTHSVLLTFAFLALIPFPPILVMGIMVLIIWHYHKRDLLAGERQTR